MYSYVSRHETPNNQARQSAEGEPGPLIIDHRQGNQPNKKKQQTFDQVKQQRDHLLESEFKYTKRIKELEKENEDLLKLYEPTYKENEQLKSQLLHGPDSQKVKKLTKEKKKLLSELEIVKDENIDLQDRVKDLEKMFSSEKEYYLEKKWREAIEKGRTRREERDALISTQGPFANARKPKKRDLKSVNDDEFEKQDAHDLHIDTLEKETQILLNKIRRIKQNKESIDYAYFIGKGAITRNSSIAKAINEKLDKDLEQFENRLENLRKRTKQLRENSSEEIEIPEKKLKPKQTGTKYFRTRHTQTNLDLEQTQTDIEPKTENSSIEKSKSKPMMKTSNISRKANRKGVLLIKSITPEADIALKSTDMHNRNSAKEVNNKLHNQPNTEQYVSGNVSRSSDERENFESPIAEHWRHLAIKLNEAEKFGGKTPYRDKIKRRASVRTGSSRRPESLSYVPEKLISTRPNSEEIISLSAKSQRSLDSIVSKSLSSEISTRLSNTEENMSETDELQNEHIDLMSQTEKGLETSDMATKGQRKTTNFGEEIRYIPRQHSLRTMKYNSDQMGRYTNGFEPIGRNRKSDNKVSYVNQMEAVEKKNMQLDENKSIKDNSHLNKPVENHRENAPRASYIVKRNVNVRSTPPSHGDEMVSRKISAYDEVLADVKKQYNDHARRQMINSRIQLNSKDQNKDDPTPLTRDINSEHFKSDSRSVFGRDIVADRGSKSRENVYNLDLL